jgi:hypothetical protein
MGGLPAGEEESAFVQILLPATAAAPPTAARTSLEVLHPGGCLIRVPGECDTGLLARVLSVLDAPSRPREGVR